MIRILAKENYPDVSERSMVEGFKNLIARWVNSIFLFFLQKNSFNAAK